MKAGEIMHKPVLTTAPEDSAHDVATKLVLNRISGMPVIDREGTVLGVVTEEDILRALMERKDLEVLAAQDIMSKNLAAVHADTPIEMVLQTLHDEGILRVPVIEDGKLLGIVSRADVIKAALHLEDGPASGKNRASQKRPKSTRAV